jgi:hypothetical protein
MHIKGSMNNGGVITNETPAAEWDTDSIASVTILRFEIIDNDTPQYLERVDERDVASIKKERAQDTWNRRAVEAPTPDPVVWTPINQ